MFHREKEMLFALGQKPPHFARGSSVQKEAEAIRHKQIAENFFDHAKRLLKAVGAFDEEHLADTYNEDRVFLVERVAAYFLDGLFPIGRAMPINVRKNRINPGLRDYIRQRLPVPLTFPQGTTPQQRQCEELIDNTADTIYGIIYRDVWQKGKVDQIGNYFLGSLDDRLRSLSYSPSDFVITDIRQAMSSLRNNLRSLGTSESPS